MGREQTTGEPKKDFFISYNKADHEWAEWIAWQLKRAGYSVIFQKWDSVPGQNFVRWMDEGLKDSKWVLAIFSPDYFDSPTRYTLDECTAAYQRGTLLPVQIKECRKQRSGLFGSIVYIDLVGLEEQQARDHLLAGVRAESAQPKDPPSFPGAVSNLPASTSPSKQSPAFPGAVPDLPATAFPSKPPPSFSGAVPIQSRINFFALVILALLIILAGSGLYLYNTIENPAYCLSSLLPIAMCGSGIGISSMNIDGNEYQIGIADGKEPTPFQPDDTGEAYVEKLIFAENENAQGAKTYFTLILLTTLSKSPLDQYLSQAVGLEDLRGAYVAQHAFNKSHPDLKLRLLIGNLGTKDVANKTAERVASQVALLMKNGGAKDNILGVIGLPLSETALPILHALHQYRVTVVSSAAASDALSNDSDAPYSDFHRILPANRQQSPYILRFIQEVLHPAKVLVISSNDSYSKTLGEDIYNSLASNRSIFVEQSTYQDEHISENMQQILRELQNNNFDLVFFAGLPNDLDPMLTQMQEQKIRLPKWIMGGGALYIPGAYIHGNYAYPLIFTSFAFPDTREQYAQNYQAAYKDAFDPNNEHRGQYGFQRAGPHSASEYDAVLAYIQAVALVGVDVNGVIDVNRVKQALQKISFTGATGTTDFQPGSVDLTKNKLFYILCVDKSNDTHAVWTYDPGPPPTDKSEEAMTVCTQEPHHS